MTPNNPTPGLITPTDRSSRQHAQMGEKKPLHFPTQRPDEHVILLLRRHWTVLARDVSQLVLSLVIPPALVGLLFYFGAFSLNPDTPLYVFVVIALSLYYLFSFLAFFHDFVDYHLDIWVVTDQRVVSIEQEGLFNRIVSELSLIRIQDVTSNIKGKVQTFLDYGQVHIQTAGETGRFVFEQVSHPAEVAKIILQVHDQAAQNGDMQRIRQAEAYRQQIDSQQTMSNQNATPTGTNPMMQPMGQPLPPLPSMAQDNVAGPTPVSMNHITLGVLPEAAPAHPTAEPVTHQPQQGRPGPHYSSAPHQPTPEQPAPPSMDRRAITPDDKDA